MQRNNKPLKTNTNSTNVNATDLLNSKLYNALKMAGFVFALSVLPIQSHAEKATNYGDINYEDGPYITLNMDSNKTEKVAYESETSPSKVLKITTKKISSNDLSKSNKAGYGDQYLDVD